MRDGTTEVAKGPVGQGEIIQRDALAAPVADLLRDSYLLLIKFDGAAGLAEDRIGDAETAQCPALAAPVADLPRDR